VPCLGVHPVQGALTGEQRCVTLQVLALLHPWTTNDGLDRFVMRSSEMHSITLFQHETDKIYLCI